MLIASGVFLYFSVYNENLFSYITNAALVPIQTIFTRIGNNADAILIRLETAREMEDEIARLKREVNTLRNMTADYYDLKNKNQQYEKYLELKNERQDFKFISAIAIGRDPGELFYNFTINKGTESGISEGDSVITENGLVGCVYRCENGASKVRTILSSDIKVGAADSTSGDKGVISGNIELCEKGLTSLTLISNQNSIKEGDIVTSTGLSGMYPKNLLVGKVISVEHDDYTSSGYAVVEPFEDIRKVRDVLVITGFQGKGEISQSVIQSSLDGSGKS